MNKKTDASTSKINYKTATKKELIKELLRLCDVVGSDQFGTKKEFLHVPNILMDGETPLACASGRMDGKTWLIVLTNHRVIFLDAGLLYGLKQVDIDLTKIVSVSAAKGLLTGDIMVSTSGQNYKISDVTKKSVIPFTNLINETREKLNKHDAPVVATVAPETDYIEKLQRLAALKESGIITDEEFQEQKQKILKNS